MNCFRKAISIITILVLTISQTLYVPAVYAENPFSWTGSLDSTNGEVIRVLSDGSIQESDAQFIRRVRKVLSSGEEKAYYHARDIISQRMYGREYSSFRDLDTERFYINWTSIIINDDPTRTTLPSREEILKIRNGPGVSNSQIVSKTPQTRVERIRMSDGRNGE